MVGMQRADVVDAAAALSTHRQRTDVVDAAASHCYAALTTNINHVT